MDPKFRNRKIKFRFYIYGNSKTCLIHQSQISNIPKHQNLPKFAENLFFDSKSEFRQNFDQNHQIHQKYHISATIAKFHYWAKNPNFGNFQKNFIGELS